MVVSLGHIVDGTQPGIAVHPYRFGSVNFFTKPTHTNTQTIRHHSRSVLVMRFIFFTRRRCVCNLSGFMTSARKRILKNENLNANCYLN